MAILEIRLRLSEEDNPLSFHCSELKGLKLTGQKNEVRGYTSGVPTNAPDLYLQGGFGSFEETSFFGECSFFNAKKELFLTCHIEFSSRDASLEYLLPRGMGTLALKDGSITLIERELKANKKPQLFYFFGKPNQEEETANEEALEEKKS